MSIYVLNEQYLNEAYFQRSKDLDNILIQLGAARNFRDRKNNTELYKFNRLVENFFGFEVFSLVVDPSQITNAYTIPIGLRYSKTSKNVIKTSMGYRYTKECRYKCLVYTSAGIFYNPEYTDREVFAILLHEIGHNFTQAFDSEINSYQFINRILKLYNMIMTLILSGLNFLKSGGDYSSLMVGLRSMTISSTVTDIYFKMKEKVMKNSAAVEALDIIDTFGNKFSDMLVNIMTFNPFNKVITAVFSAMSTFANPINLLFTKTDYRDEKIADNFATSYGFGADLASGLLKMNGSNYNILYRNLVSKVPFLSFVYDYIEIPCDAFMCILDCHPENAGRVKNQLIYLEQEAMKQDLDPKMKKSILKDIEDMENDVDTLIRDMKDTSGGTSMRKLYNMFIYDLLGGDVRDLVTNKFNKNFYNDKLDSVPQREE